MSEAVLPEYLRQSMVERVARAIALEDCCDPDFVDRKGRVQWTYHIELARAAIAAMRNPNLAMRKVCTFSEAEITWPKMIEAALEQED